jgi:hypothetical protein
MRRNHLRHDALDRVWQASSVDQALAGITLGRAA